MKKLLAAAILAGLTFLGSGPAWALSDEEDAITCDINAATLVAGWNQCANGPFSDSLGVSDVFGQVKFLNTVYAGIGDRFFFNCGLSGQITVDGWELVSILNTTTYSIDFHVTQISSCVGDQTTQLGVLVIAP